MISPLYGVAFEFIKTHERMVWREEEVWKILKEYFEDQYNIDIQEQVAVHMCGFDGIRELTTSEKSWGWGKSGQAQEWKGHG